MIARLLLVGAIAFACASAARPCDPTPPELIDPYPEAGTCARECE